MRVESLPRFLPSLIAVRVVTTGVILLIALIVLPVFGVLDVAATPMQIAEPNPFRWT
jgi:hypothetical protein